MQCENISRHFQQKAEKNAFLSRHYLLHVSISYLSIYAAEIYELEVSRSSAGCHYVDFRDKAIMTEISVFGSQALGTERQRSPSLAVKVLTSHLYSLL